MIDPPLPAPVQGGVRPPVRPGAGRFLVLLVVFVCAACGLVYELELVALASYLIGDSVTQASVVLSVMVFAMGIGSLLAKRLRCHAAVGFALVEAALALIGGCSALVLYAAFAWLGEARHALVAFSLAIGVLIGAEIPLLMTLIQRASRRGGAGGGDEDAAGTVADLFAADYVGALVGGLAFPFLLLPWLGQLTGALLTGAVNAVAGGALVLWLFRRDMSARSRWWLLVANLTVLAVLATATALVDDFESAARRAVYGEPVRVAVRTGVQEVVLTGAEHGPVKLFLDGRLQVSGGPEDRHHRALVDPAMRRGPHARVLVLGGGDGLAAREVLRHPGVRSVTVVELDPGMVRLARSDPALSALNGSVYRDPRLKVVYADAFCWLRGPVPHHAYDVVISDLPDPGVAPSAKLYSQEFYGLAADVLADGGRLAVHAGPVTARSHAYWTVEATIRAAGFTTRAYRAPGRPDRGFVLAVAAAGGAPPAPGPGVVGVEDERPRGLPPSTLLRPRYAE
ncbi:polyamine aminopropyltransferase [Streptomyces sp. MS1.AVA.4]|uniref:Polyamine aminopropyltransferase n=1 Tax=Streptomyces pratisoli TaxID=3139917 RepID=A0ACC6QJK1_9ACTN